jgi:hypothetical protein
MPSVLFRRLLKKKCRILPAVGSVGVPQLIEAPQDWRVGG